MNRTIVIVFSLVVLLMTTVGGALAQDDAMLQKYYGVIPAEKVRQEPTKYLTVPPGVTVAPRLLGAYYGRGSSQQYAYLLRTHEDGRVSLLYGWKAGQSGAGYYGGTVSPDGMSIAMDPNVRIWVSGDDVKVEWKTAGPAWMEKVALPAVVK